jgi:F0F1-type ATP synthase delta subunit
MIIPTQKYAMAFCELVEEKNFKDESLKEIIKNFGKLLNRHYQLENSEFILNQIEKYYSTNEKFVLEASIKYAGLDPKNEIKEILQGKNPLKEIRVKSEEDSSLLGGATIVIQNQLVDSSISSTLEKFKKKLKNN